MALLSVATATTAVLAQGATAGGFDALDANQDGVIDQAEWEAFSARLFDRIDLDGDGQASAEELDDAFEAFDYNKDGMIDGHEAPLVIILGDDNGDGRVAPEEFNAIDWARDSIDVDADGRISREEFGKARREVYDRADFDRSATLGRSEFEAAPSLTLFRF